MMLTIVPAAFAVNIGAGVNPGISTENYEPQVFMCDNRIVIDDATEPGRLSFDGEELVERTQNYAFEGEQIQWEVLVLDKNGVQKITDVFASVGNVQGGGNPIEVNCIERNISVLGSLRNGTMQYYTCTLTIETPLSMYGERWITVEAVDLDGLSGTMDENEYWFLNPVIALDIKGTLDFDSIRPGTHSYSKTLTIGNEADEDSGVQLDMFISGTDFYDLAHSGAACPDTNQLKLGDGQSDCDPDDVFCYFATHGAYSSQLDNRRDVEGYVGINYGIGFNDPNPFYGSFNGDDSGYEIIQGLQVGPYFPGNVLSPGAEMALTFRLNLPEPCNGNFDSGSIFFWGEAI